jgi:hypothetical protein
MVEAIPARLQPKEVTLPALPEKENGHLGEQLMFE